MKWHDDRLQGRYQPLHHEAGRDIQQDQHRDGPMQHHGDSRVARVVIRQDSLAWFSHGCHRRAGRSLAWSSTRAYDLKSQFSIGRITGRDLLAFSVVVSEGTRIRLG